MTPEKLMKKRWEAIAAFPDNRNYEVGTILDRDWCRYVNDEDENEGGVGWHCILRKGLACRCGIRS